MSIDSKDNYLPMLIDEVPFCALDFETTQLPDSSDKLAIMEIGAQRFVGNKPTSSLFQTLINPRCSIRPFDTGVSGITNKMVADKSTFLDISHDFFLYIKDHVIIAHNAPFEQRALKSQCVRDGYTIPQNLYIDTAAILRKVVKLPSYTLESASKYFNIDWISAHRAAGDCEQLVKVFWAMKTILTTNYGLRYFRDLCQLLELKVGPQPVQKTLFE